MDYGIVLPHFTAFASEDPAHRIITAAEAAEALGYSTIWVADHIVFPSQIEGGYAFNPDDPFLDPLMVLSALSLKTTRVKLGTAVLILPYRHPLAAAKALATLDVLSGGRTVVGVGAGWLEQEFDALGVSIKERGSRTDETIDIFKAAWTQDVVNFSGRHFDISDIKCLPQPVQTPRPPVLIGGMTKGALRRVARRGDGWIAMGNGPKAIEAPLESLKDLTAQTGRSIGDLQICMLPLSAPSLDQLLRDLPRYEELGVNHLYISFRAWTDDFSELMKLMERFAHEAGIQN